MSMRSHMRSNGMASSPPFPLPADFHWGFNAHSRSCFIHAEPKHSYVYLYAQMWVLCIHPSWKRWLRPLVRIQKSPQGMMRTIHNRACNQPQTARFLPAGTYALIRTFMNPLQICLDSRRRSSWSVHLTESTRVLTMESKKKPQARISAVSTMLLTGLHVATSIISYERMRKETEYYYKYIHTYLELETQPCFQTLTDVLIQLIYCLK